MVLGGFGVVLVKLAFERILLVEVLFQALLNRKRQLDPVFR